MSTDLIVRLVTLGVLIWAGIAGNEARKRGDTASMVFYCSLWLGGLIATVTV